jgi:4-hydroxy-tetrahydrodipicolinate reductase
MKIALLGYGKMGKAIEQVALQRGHEIVLRAQSDTIFSNAQLQNADVAIEFSRPEAAVHNFERCFRCGVPCVTGTTAWSAQLDSVLAACAKYQGSFLYASNFSIGVQIFMEINRRLAELMNTHNDYEVSMTEVHHTQKLDAPSGTAITLSNDVIARLDRKKAWHYPPQDADNQLLNIAALRIDPAPGTHTVAYDSAIDTIEITHTAHSRLGFATGAIVAAEFLYDKVGVFTMREVLGL